MDETIKRPLSPENRLDGKYDGRNDATSTPWNSSRTDSMKSDGAGAGSPLTVQTNDLTSQVARSTQGLVNAEVGKRTDKGATDLREVAKALRQTSKTLENNMVGPYVEKAAEQVDRASRYLQNANAKDMVRSVETFAKREPLIFLGGAFALGLLGARFMKSSSHHASADDKASDGIRGGSGAKQSSQAYGSAGRR